MTACIPDDPAYRFYPHAEADGEPPQIRIPVDGFAFAIPTALFALSHGDGFALCDRLSRRLGHRDRDSWTAFAARCLRARLRSGQAPNRVSKSRPEGRREPHAAGPEARPPIPPAFFDNCRWCPILTFRPRRCASRSGAATAVSTMSGSPIQLSHDCSVVSGIR